VEFGHPARFLPRPFEILLPVPPSIGTNRKGADVKPHPTGST